MRQHYKIAILTVAVLLGSVTIFMAQDSDPSSVATSEPQSWTEEQLDNLVAPIALYPDPLLSQVLVASTYPLEVVEADRWLQQNKRLQGQALIDAARQKPWDPSIQALVAVPDALAKLDQDIRWTTDLGDAFLAQQEDVMNAVQRMRARAEDNGRLSSTMQQAVRTQNQGGQQVIEILPTSPDIVYVPTYDPFYVWGPPVYGYYPDLYYPAYGFGFGSGFNLAFCFGGWRGWSSWGWGPNWFGGTVFVDNGFFRNYGFHERYTDRFRGRSIWRHDPDHRMHIPYANSRIAERFGGGTIAGRNSRWGTPGQRGPGTNGSDSWQGFRGQSSREQRSQDRPQSRAQVPQQNSYRPEQYRQETQVAPFARQNRQSYSNQQQSRSTIQTYRAPETQRYQAPPTFRSNSGISPSRSEGSYRARESNSSGQGRSGGYNRGGGGGGGHRR
jgi:hypothetical protein